MPESKSAGSVHESSVKHRLREELRKYLIVSAYLYICFVALELFKVALLREAGMHYLPFGLAIAKALIVGKFLLIGDSAGIGMRVAAPTVLHRITWRVVLLFILLIVLSIAEEVLVGFVHGHSMAQVLQELQQRSWPELLATSLLVLLILVPLVAVTELNRALGPGALWRVMRSPPGPAG